jgi:GIY-YIG catalytic domain/FtsK/SpoIIIE family
MAPSRRPTRTVHVPRTAITSSARIADFFELGKWTFIAYRFIAMCFRHWYIAGIILAYFLLGWRTSLAILILCPLLLTTYMWTFNRHHRFTAILRATWRLIRVRAKWKWATGKSDLTDGSRAPRLLGFPPNHHPPRLSNDRGTALEFILSLGRVGMTVRQLEDNRDYLVSSLGARRARITRVTPGVARLILEWEKSATRGSVANTHINDTLLPRVELDQDVLLELETSLLVVGESGTGKSNLSWFILNELNDRKIPYRLYVLDPKKVELQELIDSPHIQSYSDDISDMDSTVDRFHDDMMRTYDRMTQQHLRRAPLGPDWPLNILLIDEILLCGQARSQSMETNLAKVLIAGRAAGFIVIANSQLGQVDALSRLRDLFPQRICMKVTSGDLTNAVLGPKSEERGARCTEITEPGVGYIYTDWAGAFMRFKVLFIEGVSQVAAGEVWSPPQTKRWNKKKSPCFVYYLYNWQGNLIYIGKAYNPTKRIAQHIDQPWFTAIDHGRTKIKKYPNEQEALEAEQHDIENLSPVYNLQHNRKRWGAA